MMGLTVAVMTAVFSPTIYRKVVHVLDCDNPMVVLLRDDTLKFRYIIRAHWYHIVGLNTCTTPLALFPHTFMHYM